MDPDTHRDLILIVEDEGALASSIGYSLEVSGFDIALADTGPRGLDLALSHEPAVVILDVMLPGMSGLDVCRRIRASSTVPIIMLTARDSEGDKVAGLELGADDYLTKPFSMVELIARVRAQLRRAAMRSAPVERITGGGIVVDLSAHEVSAHGREVALAPKEYQLLVALMSRMGKLTTREMLFSEVWGYDFVGDPKTLDVHIKRLRSKLEMNPDDPTAIVTVRGFGYKFVDV